LGFLIKTDWGKGIKMKKQKKYYHYTECGLDNIYLLNGFKITKTNDGDEELFIHDIYGLHKAISNILGIPFGLGAGWIHGVDDNPIAQLAEKFHTQMVRVDPNKFITFDRKGNPISQDAVQKFNEKFAIFLDQAKELAFNSKYDISLSTALSSIIQQDNFSSIEQELLEAKFISLESYLGANNEVLSARYWDQDEVWPGDNCFVTDTYYSIVENLAKKCRFNLMPL
jgi:hypothetical protein